MVHFIVSVSNMHIHEGAIHAEKVYGIFDIS